MKTYGKKRHLAANRHLPRQGRPCPCCVPTKAWREAGLKTWKRRARAQGKTEVLAGSREETSDD